MASSEVITIGSVIRHRGEYNNSATYYYNNQVTMYGSVFQALGNNFNGTPPLTVATDGRVSLANTSAWKCIIDNVELYNATMVINSASGYAKKAEAVGSFELSTTATDAIVTPKTISGVNMPTIVLPSATSTTAGIMSAEQVNALQELLDEVRPLHVSVSLDKTLVEYTGTAQSVQVSYSISRKGEMEVPSSLTITVGATMKILTPASSGTYTFTLNTEGTTDITINATYDVREVIGRASVRMVAPIYCGFGSEAQSVAKSDNKLSVRTSATGTYTQTNETGYTCNLIILVPKSISTLSNFSMGGAPFVMESSSVTVNGVAYHMYKSGSVFPNGTKITLQAN